MDAVDIGLFTVILGILGVNATMITLLIRRNNSNRKAVHNPHDPDAVRLGDITIRYWREEMQGFTNQIIKAVRESATGGKKGRKQ